MTPYNIKEENEIKVRKMRLVRRKRKKEPKAKHVILSLAIYNFVFQFTLFKLPFVYYDAFLK
jgi:hypothetical protein